MFDSRRLFIVLKIPRIIACPTSCPASFPYPVAYLFISFATTKSASFPGSSLFLLTILPRPPLCNEENKNSIEDLTCFRIFTALHWKRDVSKGPFQFILETSYQSISSIGVSAVIRGPAKRLLLQIGAKIARQSRAHAFLFNLFLCAIFHVLNFA